jgi:uncharacterized protein (DUF433 family)
MNWQLYIVSDPKVLYGKPVVKNTRIPVDLILEKLATGYTIPDILDAYPNLSLEDINACLLFAADSVKNEQINLKAS